MNAADRADAVRSFQAVGKDTPTIFLLSMKAGGVGINLTAATRVFLMDPVSFIYNLCFRTHLKVVSFVGLESCH